MAARKKAAAPTEAAAESKEEARTTARSGDGPQTDHPEVVAANQAHGVGEG